MKRRKKNLTAAIKPYLPTLLLAAGIVLAFFIAGQLMSRPKIVAEVDGRKVVIDLEGYRRDCIAGVLRGGDVPASCASDEAIRKAYNVDVWLILEEERSRAVLTARRLQRGEIETDRQYKECVQSQKCLDLPEIKRGMNEQEAQAVRDLYDHLVNNGSLTGRVCDLMESCRAALKTGLLKPEQLTVP